MEGLAPIFPFPGSKRRLVPTLLRAMPVHRVYVESMAGGASLFFAKPKAEVSVLADLDPSVIGALKDFSCKKINACSKIKDTCSFAEKSLGKVKHVQSGDLCENLAARRFSIVSALHSLKSRECSTRAVVPKKLSRDCAKYEKKLRGVKLRVQDFRKTALKHDSRDAFHYIDPPYHGRITREYRTSVRPEDVCALARKLKGKVLISYNDHAEVRRACRGLHIKVVKTSYPMRSTTRGSRAATELLISNFRL